MERKIRKFVYNLYESFRLKHRKRDILIAALLIRICVAAAVTAMVLYGGKTFSVTEPNASMEERRKLAYSFVPVTTLLTLFTLPVAWAPWAYKTAPNRKNVGLGTFVMFDVFGAALMVASMISVYKYLPADWGYWKHLLAAVPLSILFAAFLAVCLNSQYGCYL